LGKVFSLEIDNGNAWEVVGVGEQAAIFGRQHSNESVMFFSDQLSAG